MMFVIFMVSWQKIELWPASVSSIYSPFIK